MPRAWACALLPVLAVLAGTVHRAAAQEAADETALGAVPDRGATVMDRPRPEVDPAGVRFGGFRLHAAATTGVGFDDNLLGTRRGRISDGFAEFGARASLVSDWTTHELGVRAGVLNRTYFSESNFDWTDWDAGVSGRFDLATNASVTAGYTHRRQHLEPQSVDIQQAGLAQPVPYSIDEFNIGGVVTLNRVTLGLGAEYQMYRYDDVPGPGGDVSFFDNNSFVTRLDGRYEFVEGRSITLGLRYQNLDYTDAAANDRDSNTYAVLVGFRYDFDGIWAARIAVGYARREYAGSQFKPLDSPAIDVNVTWNPTPITTVSFSASRSIQESIRSTVASYVSTYAQARVDHELYRNVVISGLAGVNGAEYQEPSERATDLVLGVSVNWLINRNLAMTLDYRYVNRFQHSGGLEGYDQNVAILRLRAAI